MTATIQERARRWVKRGCAPIPVPHLAKAPALAEWQTLRLTECNISEYFNSEPQNIGLLLGEPSAGLVDIDLDTDEAVSIAPMYFPKTAGFGRLSRPCSHLLFRCPGIRTQKFIHQTMILEVRSTGCQTIVPGSMHPSGEQITQTPGITEFALIEASDLLVAAGKTAAAALLARAWKELNGSRHEAALAIAGALLHSGWSGDDAVTFVGVVVTNGGDEEASDRVRAVRDTIERFKSGSAVTGWPTLAEHFDDALLKKLKTWLRINDNTHGLEMGGSDIQVVDWGEPQSLRRRLSDPDPYPITALGDVLGSMAEELQASIQAPAALCGQSVLAGAALAVQGHADIEVDGRVSPVSLYVISVGDTGERKTRIDREALAPHGKYQREKLDAYQAEFATVEAETAAWQAARKDTLSNKEYDSYEKKREAAVALGQPPKAPVMPIILVEEPTYEALQKALAVGWPSMGLFSDEGGRFLGGHGMDDRNQLKTAAGLSSLWDGTPISRTRSGDGNVLLYGRRLSMHLMIQPAVSHLLFNNELLIGQGLLSRCLVAYPTSTIGHRPYRTRPLYDSIDAKQYFARLTSILETPLPLTDSTGNELAPRRLSLTPDAKGLWVEFHDHIEALLSDGGELHSIKGVGAKAAEQCLRMAAVITLVADINGASVDRAAIESGIELAQYYLNESLRLLGAAKEDPVLLLAERLLAWLQKRGEGVVGLRTIYQSGPNPIRKKATAEQVMLILQDHGWVRPIGNGNWEIQL